MDETVEIDQATVREYLNEHFGPIAKVVVSRFRDPQVRELALRRSTRHVFHWARDREGGGASLTPDEFPEEGGIFPSAGEAVEASENGGGRDPPPAAKRGVEVSVEPEERPPEDWRTGEQPATTKQKRVLQDRGVEFSPDITKAEASRLISEVTYGGDGR